MTLTLETFPAMCIPAPDLATVGEDRFCVPMGAAFDNELFAGAIGKGSDLSRYSASLRGTGALVAKDQPAALLDLMLKTSPYVLDIRCHYPFVVQERNDPLVIDRMVTVERWDAPGELHFHAIMLNVSGLRAVQRRLEREGVSCELFVPGRWSALEIDNADYCYGLARQRNILEAKTRRDAALFAQMLYASERRRKKRSAISLARYRVPTLDRLMQRLGQRIRVSRDEAYAHLGVGIILGYVCLPPAYELSPYVPLQLAPPLVKVRAVAI